MIGREANGLVLINCYIKFLNLLTIFIQGDPFWEYHEDTDFNDPAAYSNWQKYILLLQLDSDINENDRYTGKLMWGDSGVANFFITPEDLAKRDFSRTAFMFDCH
ncbi:MAG: DUF1963 domain-containing protein, partial [Neisseria elongata]